MKMCKKIIVALLIVMSVSLVANADNLVILHTNDTHSQIDPTDKDKGGVLRRKALIDSVRGVNNNVLLVDAGDAVQGTVYFNLFKGEVEQQMMNIMGYDLCIIGNHEFDNGIEGLKSMVDMSAAQTLSTNYLFEDSLLRNKIAPYIIKCIGDKKIAFIAININPKGLVSAENYIGVGYIDGQLMADSIAKQLKEDFGADYVVALTHIGYDDDVKLAKGSRYIDVIIGGHTHDLINSADKNCKLAHKVVNQNGDSVLIAQADKSGRYVGEVTLDLDNGDKHSKVIAVDSRLDRVEPDSTMVNLIAIYRQGVDSLMNQGVATAVVDLKKDEAPLQNYVSDMVLSQAKKIYGKDIDLSIMNSGGIRNDIAKGKVSIGQIMGLLPFNNRIVVMTITGKDLLEAFDVMASRGGDCVSENVDAVFDAETKKCTIVKINGEQVNPQKIYTLATIDYLAGGGDYMTSLTRGEIVATGNKVLYDEMIEYLQSQKDAQINPSSKQRMRKK